MEQAEGCSVAQILITNTNDGKRSRTSTYTAGDIIAVRPDGFVFGARESIDEWVRQGNKAKDFPNGFVIVSVDMLLEKAKALKSMNNFPLRISNYNLNFNQLPNYHLTSREFINNSMIKGYPHIFLTLTELDACLIHRVGKKKPSDF